MPTQNMASIAVVKAWLDTATRGLCDEAKARIAEEIQAHATEGIEHLREEGLSEQAAVQRAVEDLGDPLKARREFKRIHLTERQARRVQKLIGSETMEIIKERRKWQVPLAAILLPVMLILFVSNVFESNVSRLGFAGSVIIIYLLMFWEPLLSRHKKRNDHLLLLSTAKTYLTFLVLSFSPFLALLFEPHKRRPILVYFGLLSAYIIYDVIIRLSIYRKLKYTNESQASKGDS